VLIGTGYISAKFRTDRTSNIAARWSPWKHTCASGLPGGRIHLCTLHELITFSLSIITFCLSRTTVEVSHVAAGEHMVPGPFHSGQVKMKQADIWFHRKKVPIYEDICTRILYLDIVC
jgi:hypothetical protein